jgi:radical SAM enzyme (TIGR01210 family)
MDNEEIIEKATRSCDKSYNFNETHDKSRPLQMWFQDSDEGKVLFIVFYTQACRWSQCTGCNLPSLMSKHHVNFKPIIRQIDHIFDQPELLAKGDEIKKVILSNNGSILDEETFSSTALIYLVTKLNLHFKNLKTVSIETRAEYVDFSELDFLSRTLKEGDHPTNLEIAIGFEVFNDKIRNEVFKKGLDLQVLEGLAKKLAKFDFHLKCYFMQKPIVEMTNKEAIEDIKKGIDYLSEISKKYNIRINMHLNPTYVATGTILERDFKKGLYQPPKLSDVIKALRHGKNKGISIFVGLFDEGLACEGGSFIRKGDEDIIDTLHEFNKTQNYDLL